MLSNKPTIVHPVHGAARRGGLCQERARRARFCYMRWGLRSIEAGF